LKITFDPTIKLSDVITSLSFVLAVLALVLSQQKERSAIKAAQVSEARTVLSVSLTKLERWKDVSLSVFADVQPLIIQTTEIWAKDGNVEAARDYLWRELNQLIALVDRGIATEQIKVAHVSLYPISDSLPQRFRETIREMTNASDRIRTELILAMQDVVLGFQNVGDPRITAVMGNRLREVVDPLRHRLDVQTDALIEPVRQRILAGLGLDEDALWRASRERRL